MPRLLTAILIILIVGCQGPTMHSYWKRRKDEFKYRNKTEFRSDSALRADLHNLKIANDSLFNKIGAPYVYLYSWQERSAMTNEFTVIKDAGDLGLSTYYFVLNKQDSLITYYEIASMRTDGFSWYEMSAKLFGKDTISMFLSDARRPVGSVKEPAEPFVKLRSLILGKTGVKAIMLEEIPETETVDSSKIDHCR